jgi:PAS domain S-box-containing protein
MRPRLGLRREVLILLPAALFVLVILSTFTLFSYRSSLSLLAADRRDEAGRLARSVAAALGGRPRLPRSAELRQLAPGALALAVVDASGAPLVWTEEVSLLLPPEDGPSGLGLDERLPDSVVGFAQMPAAALPGDGRPEPRWVRVDLGAEMLASQQRALDVLTLSVFGINSALVVLVLVFIGHLLAPYETLLARAREATGDGGEGGGGGSARDEMRFLLDTFEQALSALAGRAGQRAEDDIAALERTLAPSLQSGLLLLDREGRVLALNAMGAELLGTTAPAPGAPLAEVLARQPELLELLAGAVAEGSAPRREECTVRSGGELRTVGLTLHPLRRDDGGIRGHLILFADLTEARQRAEESRVAESLARLGEMAGGIAHELRNSLATLSGYLTLIERRPDEESVADYLTEIRHEASHLERVLDDFLSFARPGSTRMGELCLDRLVRRAAADPSLGEAAVRVQGDPAGEVWLRGDPQLLERAVRNLLHNAVQAEREAGRTGLVEAAVTRDDDGVTLAIEDRGPGLPPEIRERLFHPFATGRRGGVGLGLALTHRIVVLHGGRIRLDDRPGGGTRAELFFPRDTIVTPGNESRTAAAAPTGPHQRT